MLVRTRIVEIGVECGDATATWHRFLTIANDLKVSVLGTLKHDFPGGGMTGVVIIAESHLAIHTWPERSRAWCEMATCGDPAALDRFEFLLREWERETEPAKCELPKVKVSDLVHRYGKQPPGAGQIDGPASNPPPSHYPCTSCGYWATTPEPENFWTICEGCGRKVPGTRASKPPPKPPPAPPNETMTKGRLPE